MKQFSHIYMEDAAADYPVTQRILAALPRATVVPIRHYKDVFDRGGQDAAAQKAAPNLILAVKHDSFLYDGSDNCQKFGAPKAYYALPAMNCPFDCQYCFLKGMYPSANIVVFVNIGDCLQEIRELAQKGPAQVSLSYETDLVAIEHLTGFVSAFAELAPEVPELTLEIRTKAAFPMDLPLSRAQGAPASPLRSGRRESVRPLDAPRPFRGALSPLKGEREAKPEEGLLLAYTLSPDPIISRFEKKTPGLAARLSAVKAAMDAGCAVRLCFDPMIMTPGWRAIYTDFFARIREAVDFSRVRDVSIGTFRIPKDYLKNMRKAYADSEISLFPYTLEDGTYTYGEAEQELLNVALDGLSPAFPREKIFMD